MWFVLNSYNNDNLPSLVGKCALGIDKCNKDGRSVFVTKNCRRNWIRIFQAQLKLKLLNAKLFCVGDNQTTFYFSSQAAIFRLASTLDGETTLCFLSPTSNFASSIFTLLFDTNR